MTLKEAIDHCNEKAKSHDIGCNCAKEHLQLSQWLTELQQWRKLASMTPSILDAIDNKAKGDLKDRLVETNAEISNKYSVCNGRVCFSCPLQDTSYCPAEQDTPHLRIWLLAIVCTLPFAIPLILIALFLK